MAFKQIRLRAACARDAAELALLDDMASHGLASWLWHSAWQSGKAETPFECGRQRMLNTDSPVSYINATIAEDEAATAGMVIGYPIPEKIDEIEFETQVEQLIPIMELVTSARGHWYIDALCVFPEYRKMGTGALLIDDQIERARSSGNDKISLIVEDGNIPALKLYRSRKFQVVAERNYVPFSTTIPNPDKLLLMTASV